MNIKETFASLGQRFKRGDVEQVPVLGLDISHNYLRITQMDQRGDQWILLKMVSRSLDLQSQDDDAADLELVKTLLEIKSREKFTTDKVAVSLPITSAIVKVINIPILKDGELSIAVENGSLWTNTIQLPEDLSAYSIFWQVLAKDESKNQMSVLFVASRKQEIERVVSTIARAGLDALVVDVRCFALRNILRVNEAKHKGKINTFLEISAEENYIIFIDNGMPYIYDIFINDTDMDKLKNGEFDEGDPIFTRIGDQIRTSYQSFITQSGRNSIDEITLASSLNNIETIHSGLKATLPEFKLVMAAPFADIQIPANLKERVDVEKNKSSFTVSLGLATRRLDIFGYFKFVTAVSNINLLPNREERITEEKNKKSSQKVLVNVASLALVFGLVLNAIVLYASDSLGMVSRVNQLQSEAQKADEERIRLEGLSQRLTSVLDEQVVNNQKLLKLGVLSVLPNDLYIKSITVKVAGDSTMEIYGNEPSQFSNFVNLLEREKIARDVKIESIEFLGQNNISNSGEVVRRLAKIQFKVN
jgi:type IV pilus assembly protein PilN